MVAVVDVGSNTIKLLVANKCENNEIEVIHEKSIHARLGGGIGRKVSILSEDSMIDAERAILDLLAEASRFAPSEVSMVATGAVRSATNGRSFAMRIEETTRHQLNILSGEEEAEIIAHGLGTDPEVAKNEKFLACDLGGGSLELIYVEYGSIRKKASLPLGAIRLTERHVGDPSSELKEAEVRSIAKEASDRLRQSDFSSIKPCDLIVATGGAFVATRAILALRDGISFDQRKFIDRSEIKFLGEAMTSLSLQDRVKRFPPLPANRADIMPAALHCIFCVLDHFQSSKILSSLRNLRYGQAAKILGVSG